MDGCGVDVEGLGDRADDLPSSTSARSALTTLWKIDAAAAANLVSLFYQHLGEAELTKAQALQRAQAHLRSRAEAHDHITGQDS
jgi:CHAT domain-containing protein